MSEGGSSYRVSPDNFMLGTAIAQRLMSDLSQRDDGNNKGVGKGRADRRPTGPDTSIEVTSGRRTLRFA